METRFGHDFGRVRVHADPQAAQSARSVGARAWTMGHDIAFGSGFYDPSTARGVVLLAHELTHVVQQRDAIRVPLLPRGDTDAHDEHVADTHAHALAAGDRPRSLASIPTQRIQRSLLSGFLDVVLFIPRLFGLEYFPSEDLKTYLDGLKKEKTPKNSLFSDNMARACVSRETELGPYDTQTKTLLIEEMLQGWTSFLDRDSIITLLRRSASERAQIVLAVGRDRLWSKFGGESRRVIEALTLTAADAGNALVTRLRKFAPEQIQDYAANSTDAAVIESVRRAMELSSRAATALANMTAPVPAGEATITESGEAIFSINGVSVVVKPDVIKDKTQTNAKLDLTDLEVTITQENEKRPVGKFIPPKITLTIFTEYASENAQFANSAYGVGTRENEIKTLGYHERAHGGAWFTFLQNNPPPVFQGKETMLPAQFNAAVQRWHRECLAFRDRGLLFVRKAADCVGILPTDDQLRDAGYTSAICRE